MAFREPTIKEWRDNVAMAIDYQKEKGRLESWKQAKQFYMNKYPENVVSVNLIFAIGRSLVPQLYFKAPTVLVRPDRKDFAEMAPIVEAIDRKLILQMGMKKQIKLGILDAFVSNIAVFKFGYHSVATELPSKKVKNGITNDLVQALAVDGEFGQEEEEVEVDDKLKTYSYHDNVRADSPWMLRVNPEDFFVPYGTLDIESAPWCAFRIVRRLADIKNDPLYKNTAGLVATTTLIPEAESTSGAKSPNMHKQAGMGHGNNLDAVELFEIWDKRSGKIIVIQKDQQLPLRNEKHGLPIQGLPVELLQFNNVGWDFWGPTDVEQIAQQQIEYNETRTLELLHKRMSVAKFFFDKGSIDDAELSKFVAGKISAVKIKGNPNTAVRELNPSMSRDLFNVSDIIRQDIGEVLGFNRNQGGEFNVSRRTATEAGIVQKAIELRSDERRDQVADLIAAAFQRKINPLIFQQWTAQRSVEVTGKQGWTQYTAAQIKGDYLVTVVADSVVPLTQQQRQQSAMLALDRFINDPRIDQNRLYAWALGQFQDLGMPADLLVDEEEFAKQQQQQLLQALAQQGAGGQQGQRQQTRGNGGINNGQT